MKVLIVQVVDPDANKAADAFEIVVDALHTKETLIMAFECESTKEAAERLAELAKKEPLMSAQPTKPLYDDGEYGFGCF